VGRALLSTSWNRLFGDAWTSNQELDTPFSWQPNEGARPIELKPAVAIADTWALCLQQQPSIKASALVVPDQLSDGALQLLNTSIKKSQSRFRQPSANGENTRNMLLWRSAALGISWCRHTAFYYCYSRAFSKLGKPRNEHRTQCTHP
jgi:hypothetical protein